MTVWAMTSANWYYKRYWIPKRKDNEIRKVVREDMIHDSRNGKDIKAI